tara:strand:- start:845 stop:1048 length:204 start_codon:yes stop_codon:yes gene_type:complete
MKKKIKLPWFDLVMILKNQITSILADVQDAREDDGKVSQAEIRNIVAENLLEVVPPIAEAIFAANKG